MRLLPKRHSFESVAEELLDGFRNGTVVPRLTAPPLTIEQEAAAYAEARAEVDVLWARFAKLGLLEPTDFPPPPSFEVWVAAERRQPGITAGKLDEMRELLQKFADLERSIRRSRAKMNTYLLMASLALLVQVVSMSLLFGRLFPRETTLPIVAAISFVILQLVAFAAGYAAHRWWNGSAQEKTEWIDSARAAVASLSDGFAKLGLPHG